MANPTKNSKDFTQQINLNMSKLSDRDTEPLAAATLESIARTLTPNLFPPFLSAISARDTDKPTLRRHSLRLVAILAANPDASPHVPRMCSLILKRIRDSDSCVRSSCIDAVRAVAAASEENECVFDKLSYVLFHEQECCAQMTAAFCLIAVVEECKCLDLSHFVVRIVKLVKSNAFKAKAALVELIGCVAGKGGVKGVSLMKLVLDCLVEFLKSEDWNARKAASEALFRVGNRERKSLGVFKRDCLVVFESQRFDKVKIVRESMNKMIEAWKEIPGVDDLDHADDSKSQNSSSRRGSMSDRRFGSSSVKSASPFTLGKNKNSRSPPANSTPVTIAKKKNASNNERKISPNNKKDSDSRLDIEAVFEEKLMNSKENNVVSKFEAKRILFENKLEDKSIKLLGGLKSASRVVPFEENESSEFIMGVDNFTDDFCGEHKDGDLSLIRKQLLQIESQQSSLLDLLQRYIGNSQKGIHSLEKRVNGLEMVLDEISRDLSVSSVKTCCSLPGAEFLSPKFWRKTEGSMHFFDERRGREFYNKQRVGLQKSFAVNPLSEARDG